MGAVKNQCAGPFGAIYDFYIERPWLARIIGRGMWGISLDPLYASMEVVGRAPAGATIVDVPCGGGLALRSLQPEQEVRFVAVDIDPVMLERTRAKASQRGLAQVETVEGDMTALPFEDATADLFLSYSGLHMIGDPLPAIAEIARCLKPGGRLEGSTFVSDGSGRQRALFRAGARSGHAPLHGTAAAYAGWLRDVGLEDVTVEGRGFAIISARKP